MRIPMHIAIAAVGIPIEGLIRSLDQTCRRRVLQRRCNGCHRLRRLHRALGNRPERRRRDRRAGWHALLTQPARKPAGLFLDHQRLLQETRRCKLAVAIAVDCSMRSTRRRPLRWSAPRRNDFPCEWPLLFEPRGCSRRRSGPNHRRLYLRGVGSRSCVHATRMPRGLVADWRACGERMPKLLR